MGDVMTHWQCRGRHTAYLRAGFPCVADHPIQSFPLADPLDYMLLLGSLKDQEENLIVVNRGHRGKRREDIPNNQQLFQSQHWNTIHNILAVTFKTGCVFMSWLCYQDYRITMLCGGPNKQVCQVSPLEQNLFLYLPLMQNSGSAFQC